MKKLLILSALFCSQIIQAQIPQNLTDKLNHTYDSLCARYHIKGSSAAVFIPNMGTWKRTYGVSYAGTPINENMLISLGSNTKTYTASVILKLHQDGLLNIDDTIGKWFVNVPNIKGSITIKQLLGQTSGIASYTDNITFWSTINSDLTKKWTPDEILPYIGPQLFNPGANWGYSNSNFLLAGIIITKVTNKSLAEAYHQYIFTPIGLSKTILATEETTSMEYAHRWSDGIGNPYLTDFDDMGYSYDAMNSVSWAAGGLYATAEDNALFFDGLFNKKSMMADSMLAKMKTVRTVGNGMSYGLGLMALAGFNGRTVYSHGGSNTGANNENVYDPISGCAISLLTNQDSISNNQLLVGIVLPLHKNLVDLKAGIGNPEMNGITAVVYPNPSTGTINIDTKDISYPLGFSLYDLSGKKIRSEQLHSAHAALDLDCAPGLYFYALVSQDGRIKNGRLMVR
jgi:D-alanyl-D-alanine carboxypeptidase